MIKMPLIILMMIMLLISTGNSENYSDRTSPPALYVLGDSIFDSGNNNLLPTLAKANYPPYGMNFDKGPTGRFTNGRTVVDFIAEYLGLPYSPPYLSIKRLFLHPWKLTVTGLNYASGSCGILPETGKYLGKCLNFDEQIKLFEKTVKKDLPKHYKNSSELSNYLAKSIFVISVGSNDYINNYLDTQHYDTSKHYSPRSYAILLVDRLSEQLQRLYYLGARRVIMFEIGPLGCMPSITRQVEHDGQKCVNEINLLAEKFNDRLAPMLRNLTYTLPDSSFVLGRAHSLGYDAAVNPSKYGLSDSTTACCVTWFNGTSGCIPGARACPNPDKYYFWDGYHLTETLYKIIAINCFNGSVCMPKNIKQLVSEV